MGQEGHRWFGHDQAPLDLTTLKPFWLVYFFKLVSLCKLIICIIAGTFLCQYFPKIFKASSSTSKWTAFTGSGVWSNSNTLVHFTILLSLFHWLCLSPIASLSWNTARRFGDGAYPHHHRSLSILSVSCSLRNSASQRTRLRQNITIMAH